MSLFVSISVIPAVTNKFYTLSKRKVTQTDTAPPKGNPFVRIIMSISNLTHRNAFSKIATVMVFTAASAMAVMALIPKAEYLPQGNRNLILNILVPYPWRRPAALSASPWWTGCWRPSLSIFW